MENNANGQASSARIFSSTLNVTECCKNGAPPPCTAACPYGLDVRELVRRLQRGSFRGANNFLAEQLLFPQTMCAICGAPCLEACGQELGGQAIRLPLLERAAFEHSGKKRPTVFRVPPKQEKVAVVGGGLSGLCCAYALASLGYSVTVIDKRARLGGRLNELLPEEAFLPELTQALALPNVELCLEHPVGDLEELSAFQGILIATGAGGDSFGLGTGNQKPGVFAAGELTGSTLPGTVQSGKQAASALDAYLKTGSVSGQKQTPCITTQAAYGPVLTLPAETLDKTQAQEEATRCRRCDCTHCYDACDLLQYYKTTPQKLEADVRVTLNPVDRFMARRATRLISSCNDCGLCGDVCPEQIDLRALLMESRTVMNQEGSIPPAYHDFWLRDMAFSTGEGTVHLSAPSNGYLFFPGCQLGASNPDYVKQAYNILQDVLPGTGLLLNCCGVPAKWAGERDLFRTHLDQLKAIWKAQGNPRFVTACPTCQKTLNEDLPEVEVISLYALLAEHFTPPPGGEGERVALFHPCSSREFPEERESVQTLLRRCGLEPEEPGNAGCCGFGGHIYPANPELFDAVAEKRTSASPLPYVTYCANCRDVFTAKGKDCRHVLDVLSNTGHRDRPLPTLQQRRKNRLELKAYFSGEPFKMEEPMKLIISDELRQRLDRMLILDEDVEAVIRRCVNEQRFIKTEDGRCIGHLKQGTLTYWVVWRCAEDAYQVLNVYSHRMSIEGE